MTEYKLPSLTVDAIIEKDGTILMIRRKNNTFDGYLALPGGFVDYGESVEDAVKREIMEELNLEIKPLEILGVYSEHGRDPRRHTVSTIFICSFEGTPRAGDDARDFEWISLENLPTEEFAFDHFQIMEDYKLWKTRKGTYWSTKTRN